MNRVGVVHTLRVMGGLFRFSLTRFVRTVVVFTVDAVFGVAELPVPLECRDVNGNLWILIQCGDLLLGLHREEEQGHDDQDWNDGQHHLQWHVVLRLAREFTLAIALSLLRAPAEDCSKEEAPHDEADNPSCYPDPDPEVVHCLSLRGHTLWPTESQEVLYSSWRLNVTTSQGETA